MVPNARFSPYDSCTVLLIPLVWPVVADINHKYTPNSKNSQSAYYWNRLNNPPTPLWTFCKARQTQFCNSFPVQSLVKNQSQPSSIPMILPMNLWYLHHPNISHTFPILKMLGSPSNSSPQKKSMAESIPPNHTYQTSSFFHPVTSCKARGGRRGDDHRGTRLHRVSCQQHRVQRHQGGTGHGGGVELGGLHHDA